MGDPLRSVSPDQETLPRQDLDLGCVGRYRLLEKVGGGGMGVVYKATHLALHRIVAVKLLHPDRAHLDHLSARFAREMEAAGKLDHPNIVRATDAGQEGDTLFLVMEYIQGIDLDHLIRLLHPLPVPEVCELVRQAALGLEAIRAVDMVHRDIKPSNLMLTEHGVVKILDVGLALLRDTHMKCEELTPQGATLGTADYLAPEQAGDSKQVDIRADIYSLGCTMYKLLAGETPYRGVETWAAKLKAHLFDPMPPIVTRTDIPNGVLAILRRMMEKDRNARFATPAELAEALRSWSVQADVCRLAKQESVSLVASLKEPWLSEGDTPLARATTVVDPTSPKKRSRGWIGFAALPLIAGALVLAASPWLNPKDEQSATKKAEGEQPVKFLANADAAKEPMPDLTETTPLKLTDVLDRAPREILLDLGTGLTSYRYQDNLRQLEVSSENLTLLGVATTSSPRFGIQVSMYQPNWSGGCGVFFGYRLFDDAERKAKGLEPDRVAQFQFLHVYDGADERSKGPVLMVRRSACRLVRRKDGRLRTEGLPIDAREKVDLSPGHQSLEFSIGDGALQSVRFGGQRLPQLIDFSVNRKFEARDYEGGIGAYNLVCSTTYRNFHFTKYP
ncbi:MAG: serine/threonine-protein kinase [Gemmataceae bacterium]